MADETAALLFGRARANSGVKSYAAIGDEQSHRVGINAPAADYLGTDSSGNHNNDDNEEDDGKLAFDSEDALYRLESSELLSDGGAVRQQQQQDDEDIGKLSFRDVSYYRSAHVQRYPEGHPLNLLHRIGADAAAPRQILRNITLKLRPGQLVCLMGGPGSGKTSLLKLLGGQLAPSSGRVLFDQHALESTKSLRHVISFVPEQDILYPSLTPRQLLGYLSELQLPDLPPAERLLHAERLIDFMNLRHCADTIIGRTSSSSSRSLTTGITLFERKKVSIAMGLVSNPKLLCVDEPTSQLDAAQSRELVNLLNVLAAAGRSVVCTLRDPMWDVCLRFHRLVLLDQGRVLFDGPVACVIDKFAAAGFVPPSNENPLSYIMATLAEQAERGLPVQLDSLTWTQDSSQPSDYILHQRTATTQPHDQHVEAVADIAGDSCFQCIGSLVPRDPRTRPYLSPFYFQLYVLVRRTAFMGINDVTTFLVRTLLALLIGLFLGLCFYQLPDTQASAWTRSSMLFTIVLFVGTANLMLAIRVVPKELTTVLREHRSGAFSSTAYYLSKVLVEGMYQLFYTALFATIVYWVAGLTATAAQFFTFLGSNLLVAVIALNIGLVIGAVAESADRAQVVVMPILGVLVLFTGYIIPQHDIPAPLVWIFWLSFYQYGFKMLAVFQFSAITFRDCPASANATNFCPFGPGIVSGSDALRLTLGFDQESIHVAAIVLCSIAFGLLLAGLISFWYRLRNASH